MVRQNGSVKQGVPYKAVPNAVCIAPKTAAVAAAPPALSKRDEDDGTKNTLTAILVKAELKPHSPVRISVWNGAPNTTPPRIDPSVLPPNACSASIGEYVAIPPTIRPPLSADSTTNICDIPVKGVVIRSSNWILLLVVVLLLLTVTAAAAAATTPSLCSVVVATSGVAGIGSVRNKEVKVTILKAQVHCGTLLSVSSDTAATTKGVTAAPTRVAVVAASIEVAEGPKTAAAQPTKHPLYPYTPA